MKRQKDSNANLIYLETELYNKFEGNYYLNTNTKYATSGVLHRNSGEDVLPAFDKTVHEYWMEVENSTTHMVVNASVERRN